MQTAASSAFSAATSTTGSDLRPLTPPAAVTPSANDVTSPAVPSAPVTPDTIALNVEDAAAIDELVTAYHESLRVQPADGCLEPAAGDTETPTRSHSTASSLSDMVNVAELSVRRVIAMAKQVR